MGSPSVPKGNSRRRPEGRDEIKAAVLDVAASLFAERGPSQVTIREIAQRANVNHALVHRHFDTKEALLRSVMARLTPPGGGRITTETEWRTAIDLIFARGTLHATYARMLAWLVLQSDVEVALVESFPVVETLITLAAAEMEGSDGDEEARVAVAAAELMALGWQLFGPYVAKMLKLDHMGLDELGRRLATAVADVDKFRTQTSP